MATNNAVNTSLSGQSGTGSFAGSISPTFTGTPIIPTPFTLGATSVTSTGTQLNLLNALTTVPINQVAVQVFNSSGAATYTPNAKMIYCWARAVGGGGGGGGCPNSTAAQVIMGGGGGGGGYSEGIFTRAIIIGAGTTASVNVGAAGTAGAATGSGMGGTGGTTTLIANGGVGTTLLSSAGGQGGGNAGSLATSVGIPGGGGVPSAASANIVIKGQPGEPGFGTAITGISGAGGGSLMGWGGASIPTAGAFGAGSVGQEYGGGGGGAVSTNATGAAIGGAGIVGLLIIWEFLSA